MLIQRWWRVRLSGHGAFNDTVLAKQVWRIIKNEDSLVARLIKAKYYYDCDIFATPYEDFWTPRFRTLADCITNASHTLDDDAFGDLLAVMWECWNARNRFIFSSPDRNLATLGKCALDFVRSYHLHQETTPPRRGSPLCQDSAAPGYVKLNFDGAIFGESFSGWCFVLRDHDNNILLAGTKPSWRTIASIEEARASTVFNAPMTMASAMSSSRATVSFSSNCSKSNQSLITF